MISIVIPVRNGASRLVRLFDAIERQSVDEPYELIVVDSGSTDGTQDLARSAGARVHQIAPHEFNHGGTRNTGAALAQGETLVFTVDDALPADEHWLERLTAPLRTPSEVAGTYARQVPHDDVTPPQRFYLERRYGTSPRAQRVGPGGVVDVDAILFSNVSSAMRRSVWERFPFAPDMLTAEDLEWARRVLTAGHVILYVPDAVVQHSHRYTLGSVFRRYVDQGVAAERTVLADERAAPGSVRKAGARLVREELEWLRATGRARWLPYTLAFEAVRFLGFHLGTGHRMLPRALLRRWSHFPVYWTDEALRARASTTDNSGGLR